MSAKSDANRVVPGVPIQLHSTVRRGDGKARGGGVSCCGSGTVQDGRSLTDSVCSPGTSLSRPIVDHSLCLRLARDSDVEPLNGIYNYYVLHSTSTYQETPDTEQDRLRWLADRDCNSHPVIVAEWGGVVVGFGALSSFHRRSAYRYSVEDAVYVAPEWHRQGIGSAILQALIDRARSAGHRSIIALIDSTQGASIRLHGRHGFVLVGSLQSAGRKFDRWLDVQYHQLLLDR